MSLSTNSKEVRLEMQHKKLSGVNLRQGEPLTTVDRRDLLERMPWTGSIAAGHKKAKSASFAPANPDVQATCFTVAGPAKQ
jgi:hypothetical protein